jgi:hypothetical protein
VDIPDLPVTFPIHSENTPALTGRPEPAGLGGIPVIWFTYGMYVVMTEPDG